MAPPPEGERSLRGEASELPPLDGNPGPARPLCAAAAALIVSSAIDAALEAWPGDGADPQDPGLRTLA